MKCVHKQFTIYLLIFGWWYGKILSVKANGKPEKTVRKEEKQ